MHDYIVVANLDVLVILGVRVFFESVGQFFVVLGDRFFVWGFDMVLAADDAFMALPANVRERFNNDPAELVDFISDVANRSEAIDLGLIPLPGKPDGVIPSPEVVKPTAEA